MTLNTCRTIKVTTAKIKT